MKVLVFIPSFNDQNHLNRLIGELLKSSELNTVLVIDDGSFPPLRIDSRDQKSVLFRIPYNAGLGVSTNIALDTAFYHGYDYLVRIDADGQHPTENVKLIIDKLIKDKVDICIGERINHEDINTVRGIFAVLLKRHMKFIANKLTSSDIRDWNTGFFALNQKGIKKLAQFSYARYPEIELYLRASQTKLAISSITIEQKDRTDGKSTLNIEQSIRIVIRFYLIILRLLIEKRFKCSKLYSRY